MKNMILLISVVTVLSGCITRIPDPINLDPSALQDQEKSYTIKRGTLQFPDGSDIKITKDNPVPFGSWFIVHEDFIRQHNENQDDLIDSFKVIQNLKRKKTIIIIGGLIVLSILAIRKK